MNKFTDNDAAVQIAEEAFNAGWDACLNWVKNAPRADGAPLPSSTVPKHDAWSDFEPSEDCKALAGDSKYQQDQN
jgi:hypothetical protein